MSRLCTRTRSWKEGSRQRVWYTITTTTTQTTVARRKIIRPPVAASRRHRPPPTSARARERERASKKCAAALNIPSITLRHLCPTDGHATRPQTSSSTRAAPYANATVHQEGATAARTPAAASRCSGRCSTARKKSSRTRTSSTTLTAAASYTCDRTFAGTGRCRAKEAGDSASVPPAPAPFTTRSSHRRTPSAYAGTKKEARAYGGVSLRCRSASP